MAAPLIIGTVMAALALIFKAVSATANVVSSVLHALIAWFIAHKIFFSIVLLLAWVASWVLIVNLFWRLAAWFAAIQISSMPSLQFLEVGFNVLASWINLQLFPTTIGLIFSCFSARIAVNRVFWARLFVTNFIKSVSSTFHG